MFGGRRVFAVVHRIGDDAVEPVAVEVLALVSDVEHHPGVVEARALVQLALAGRKDARDRHRIVIQFYGL